MKMDAMQKRRMWKVAFIHFLFTLFVAWKLGSRLIGANSYEREIWMSGWGGFWEKFLWLLQPQIFGIKMLPLIHNFFPIFYGWLFPALVLFSFPFWSFCFAWILVKLDDWLNHFPVLGKKVF
jgi:hypothetical protein